MTISTPILIILIAAIFILLCSVCVCSSIYNKKYKRKDKECFVENFDNPQPGQFLISDPNGNLSAYNPGRGNTLVSDSTGNIATVQTGLFNFNTITANQGITGTTGTFSGELTANGGITGTTATFTGVIKGNYDYDAFSEVGVAGTELLPASGWDVYLNSTSWDPMIRGGARKGSAQSKVENDQDASAITVDIAVPAGMKSAFVHYLPWSNCRYFEIWGVLAAGEVFIKRVTAFQSARNGGPNQINDYHDGISIAVVPRADRFSKIRIRGKVGRIHYMGTGWNKQIVGSDAGYTHADNVFGTVASSNISNVSNRLSITDTRNTNESPSYYAGRVGVTTEFKLGSAIGLGTGFFSLETTAPYHDNSGGIPIRQKAFQSKTNQYVRYAMPAVTTWGAWINTSENTNITNNWQNTANPTTSEISNDTSSFKQLMIIGNSSGNGSTRKVGIWDQLDVNGSLNVTNGISSTSTYPLNINNWLFHIAGDSRLVIAPKKADGTPDWENEYTFHPTEKRFCIGNVCINKDELARLKTVPEAVRGAGWHLSQIKNKTWSQPGWKDDLQNAAGHLCGNLSGGC